MQKKTRKGQLTSPATLGVPLASGQQDKEPMGGAADVTFSDDRTSASTAAGIRNVQNQKKRESVPNAGGLAVECDDKSSVNTDWHTASTSDSLKWR